MGTEKRRRITFNNNKKHNHSATATKAALDLAVRKLDMQIAKLDQANERFTQKDRTLFAKLVDAYTHHDQPHANIYATELAEIRKMGKIIMNARLALDQISLRIKTVSELGDVVATLGPCIGVLRSVSSRNWRCFT